MVKGYFFSFVCTYVCMYMHTPTHDFWCSYYGNWMSIYTIKACSLEISKSASCINKHTNISTCNHIKPSSLSYYYMQYILTYICLHILKNDKRFWIYILHVRTTTRPNAMVIMLINPQAIARKLFLTFSVCSRCKLLFNECITKIYSIRRDTIWRWFHPKEGILIWTWFIHHITQLIFTWYFTKLHRNYCEMGYSNLTCHITCMPWKKWNMIKHICIYVYIFY